MHDVAFQGVGSFLPDEVRGNDWWSDRVVTEWTKTALDSRRRIEEAIASTPSEGQRLVLAAMLEVQADPFRGIRERRVMAANMESSAMEAEAGRAAMRAAGVAAADIDVVLSHSMVPDDLLVPNAVAVHEKLGLRDDCLATSVEATCNSFLIQLALAEQLVATGHARHVLLIQSCALSRLIDPAEAQSAWFGDGATAVVIGAARENGRILGRTDVTDSRLRNAVVTGVPGRRWYDGGQPSFHAKDRRAAYEILLGFADYGKRVIDGALAKADIRASDVSFFACHQAQIWQRRVAQSFAGLGHARTLDTFAWAGNLAGANIPLVLEVAQRERILRDGDVVAMYGGGAGVTVSGVIAKWGQ